MEKTFSRQELYDLVWTEPLLTLSKKFDISDVGLRKTCQRHDIPLPKVGHWQKVRAGKKNNRPALPGSNSNEPITLIEMERAVNGKTYRWTERQTEIENDPNLNLLVPEKLRRPEEEVATARRAILNTENKGYSELGAFLDISVSSKLVRRALTFMDTLIKLLRARGHDIRVQYSHTDIIIKEQSIRVQVRERSRIVKHPEGHWPSREFIPTGVLVFKADGYHGTEWIDGATKIEERLSNIVARLETSVEDLLEFWRQNDLREEEEQARLRKIQEEEDRKDNELRNFKGLMQHAKRWKRAMILREFLEDVRKRSKMDGVTAGRIDSWLDWAEKKVDWYDPNRESDDTLLADVDRNTLKRK